MSKISFKVSARTAKLIGQENFSNPEGAMIELVKNCYDADAKNCLVVFDILFGNIPELLSSKDFTNYSQQSEIVKTSYKLKDTKYFIANSLSQKRVKELQSFFFSFNSIYIIDNGDGMTQSIIQNQWMEIGTGNKETNYISDNGRVKTGAKGIGRFALDRLGFFAEMWTVSKDQKSGNGFYWSMDWQQFDTPNKSILDIEADLEEKNLNLNFFLQDNFKNNSRLIDFIKSLSLESGTIIKISKLKDNWSETSIQNVFKSLEALIPPKELAIPFKVNLFQLQKPKLFGEVETAYFNDYDYKIVSKFNSKDLSININVNRNELDLEKVKKDFSHIFKNAKSPYDLKTLQKREFNISKPVFEVLKWTENKQNFTILKNLGDVSFSLYFLKNVISKDYPYKNINTKERKEIIEKFGGIKIYRDSFRVRPYGDIGNDWLKLGDRAAISPAGAGQRVGDWRVNPNQVAGIITISRIENPNLIDKSDRGSLQENEFFDILKKIITAIINEFEIDRSKILNPIYEDTQIKKEKAREDEIKKEAEKLVDQIIFERQKVEHKVYGSRPNLFTEKKEQEEKDVYEKLISRSLEKFNKNDNDNAEIAQIRTLASLGLIVSSFAHELKEAKNNFNDILKIEKLFNKIIPEDKKKSVDYNDTIDIIELLKAENEKISHWVDYSLTAIKKDKRKRGIIKFDKFFISLNKTWKTVLENRNVKLEIKNSITKSYVFRAFEMDMNTVFNNLISNSIDAFNNLKTIRDRKISIIFSLFKGNIHIVYADNGTGIPNVFKKNRDEIFLPFITSKKDRDGNDIGTGLGMYLVKNVITDNNGTVKLMDTAIGFKLKIELPLRINNHEI